MTTEPSEAKVTESDLTEETDSKSNIHESQLETKTSLNMHPHQKYFETIYQRLVFNPNYDPRIHRLSAHGFRVNSDSMRDFFKMVYCAFIDCIDHNQAQIISAENFELVCRYLVVARCDYVYQEVSYVPLLNAVKLLPIKLELPNSIAQVINGLGVVQVWDKSVTIVSQREENINWIPADIDQHLKQFNCLVNCLKQRGVITTSLLSRKHSGSYWWMIGVHKMGNDDLLMLCSSPDPTREDYVLAGKIQREFDGIIKEICNTTNYSMKLRDVATERIQFALS